MEKLTLVVPTFNSSKFLIELIEKLRELNNIKVIFIDDGSTYKERKLLERLVREITARVIFNQHKGVSYARNSGLELVDTPYVAFLDSDDMLDTKIFQVIIDKLDVSLGYDIFSFANGLPDVLYTTESAKKNLAKQVLKIIPSRECIPAPFSKLYRVEFLRQNHINFDSDVKVGEDMLFNVSAFLDAKSIYISGKSYYLYRQNLDSVTHKAEYDIVTNNRHFLNALNIILFDRLSELDARAWLQEMVIITWVSDSFQAVIQTKNNAPLVELRKYLVEHIDFKKLFVNTLPLRRKFLGWLLFIKQYTIVRRLIGKRKKFDQGLAAESGLVKI